MALQSSGAISFAQIAAEFGGTAPHSMSEYYTLLGQGVSGLPSSGTFNFSHFHGKDKDVAVWTASGYNTTTLTSIGSIQNSSYGSHSYQGNNNYQIGMKIAGGYYSYASRWVGSTYYVPSGGGGPTFSRPLARYQNVTTFTDTSANVWHVASVSG
tara:strand:+ start:536 stop:1000 length:465 start_codon:yes stop_codon:yes gene_type:complete